MYLGCTVDSKGIGYELNKILYIHVESNAVMQNVPVNKIIQ